MGRMVRWDVTSRHTTPGWSQQAQRSSHTKLLLEQHPLARNHQSLWSGPAGANLLASCDKDNQSFIEKIDYGMCEGERGM